MSARFSSWSTARGADDTRGRPSDRGGGLSWLAVRVRWIEQKASAVSLGASPAPTFTGSVLGYRSIPQFEPVQTKRGRGAGKSRQWWHPKCKRLVRRVEIDQTAGKDCVELYEDSPATASKAAQKTDGAFIGSGVHGDVANPECVVLPKATIPPTSSPRWTWTSKAHSARSKSKQRTEAPFWTRLRLAGLVPTKIVLRTFGQSCFGPKCFIDRDVRRGRLSGNTRKCTVYVTTKILLPVMFFRCDSRKIRRTLAQC